MQSRCRLVVALICLCTWHTALSKRAITYTAKARSSNLWNDLVHESNVASYGRPAVQVLTRATSADHFSKFLLASLLPMSVCGQVLRADVAGRFCGHTLACMTLACMTLACMTLASMTLACMTLKTQLHNSNIAEAAACP